MNPGTVRFATGVNAFSVVSCGRVDVCCGVDGVDDELIVILTLHFGHSSSVCFLDFKIVGVGGMMMLL